MKTLLAIIFSGLLFLTGCSSATSEPVSLDGSWSGEIANSEVSFVGDVKDGEIELFLEMGGVKGLYWAGTFPTEVTGDTQITSEVETEKLKNALYGSSLDEKDFNYKGGKIIFEFQILGTYQDITLTKE